MSDSSQLVDVDADLAQYEYLPSCVRRLIMEMESRVASAPLSSCSACGRLLGHCDDVPMDELELLNHGFISESGAQRYLSDRQSAETKVLPLEKKQEGYCHKKISFADVVETVNYIPTESVTTVTSDTQTSTAESHTVLVSMQSDLNTSISSDILAQKLSPTLTHGHQVFTSIEHGTVSVWATNKVRAVLHHKKNGDWVYCERYVDEPCRNRVLKGEWVTEMKKSFLNVEWFGCRA